MFAPSSGFTGFGPVEQTDGNHTKKCQNREDIKGGNREKVHSVLGVTHGPNKNNGGDRANHQIRKNQRIYIHRDGSTFDDRASANIRHATAVREPLKNTAVVIAAMPLGTKYPMTVEAMSILDTSARYCDNITTWLRFSRMSLWYREYVATVKDAYIKT